MRYHSSVSPVPSALSGEIALLPLDFLLAEANALVIQARKRTETTRAESARLSAARAVLQLLEAYGPQTVPELARRRLTSRQNIQIIVNRFVAEAAVEVKPNPAHRKSSLVWLTEKGRSVLAQTMPAEAAGTVLPVTVSEAEIHNAAVLLQRLRESWTPWTKPASRNGELLPASPQPVSETAPQAPQTQAPLMPELPVETVEDFPVNLL